MEKNEIHLLVGFSLILIVLVSACVDQEQHGNPLEVSHVSIGYIGCSNTRETVEGYHRVGGTEMWDYDKRYDAGAVADWSRNAEMGNKYWDVFDSFLKENPNTTVVWWQLCVRDDERGTDYDQAVRVLDAARKRIPGAIFYVSGLADYTDGVCEITGTFGIEKAKELVQQLVENNEDVLAGPVLGPMSLVETAEDGCHLSPDGKRKLGEQMKQFFDEVETKTLEENDSEEQRSSVQIPAETEKPLTPEEKTWRDRIEAAMAPSLCPETLEQKFPASYYQGPLIDTHLHIPSIPDWSPEEDTLPGNQTPEGRFGGPQALLGWNIKMSEIACTIKREETQRNFAFFPVYEEIPEQLLEIWNRTMKEYPEQFTPFIMSSGNDGDPDGFPTVDAKTLQEMLAVYPGLFEGYGEIGLYARENGGSPELPPDSQRLLEIYPLIRENNLVIYFHLGEGHKDNFEKVLRQNPDIKFIWHGDQLSVHEVENILTTYPNAYYGIDAFWGHDRDLFLLFVGKSKEAYVQKLNETFDTVLNYAVSDWKAVIERHPDQVIWGIDRGDAVWNYDLDVGQLQVKLARAFIGKLDPSVQEIFAYETAERLLSK